jgi:diguanylate cyclase (GGDEF)-like protein
MKRSVSGLAIFVALVSAAGAAQQSALTSLHAIHNLTNAQASKALPVAFEATVTYYRSYEQVLFVQDDGDAIYVQDSAAANLVPGDRVLVRGKTHNSYRPEIFADSVTFLHHGELPKPLPATFDALIRGELDCQFVRIRAVMRTADISLSMTSPVRSISIRAVTDGGVIRINLDSDNADALKDLLDAEIDAVGVVSGSFDGKDQLTGIELNVSKLTDIHILKRASLVPWSLPAMSMSDILSTYHEQSLTKRVLVHGAITYYQPGSMVVLQNGDKALRMMMTHTYTPLRIGDMADATGFPDLRDGFLTLTSAEVKDSLVAAPIDPMPATWQQLSSSTKLFELVSIEGVVSMRAREAAQDEYVLTTSDGHLFSAIYRHPSAASLLSVPVFKEVTVGARIRVTGICIPYDSDAFSGPVPFDILLRSPDDVTVIAGPSWMSSRRNLFILILVLLGGLLAVGARAWIVERSVRQKTASLGYIERRRSRILEDINNSRPLATIMEQITELVSFMMKGAPCWCQIADGAQLGNCPAKLDAFRVVQQEIPARSGHSLGVILAALDPLTTPQAVETEALSMATALSALAIETRRLYTDLRRRSEFDLLTDTHNRFSLDKQLDALIAEARLSAGIFGLIYIDLNEFKQINDLYGHNVGDVYLREVVLRMKRQLRSVDTLARLGGDEFAALVPVVHSRADVEEIAERLDHSFDEAFTIEGFTIQGSASVGIAIYPADGTTKDALLNCADTAMYMEKNTRR